MWRPLRRLPFPRHPPPTRGALSLAARCVPRAGQRGAILYCTRTIHVCHTCTARQVLFQFSPSFHPVFKVCQSWALFAPGPQPPTVAPAPGASAARPPYLSRAWIPAPPFDRFLLPRILALGICLLHDALRRAGIAVCNLNIDSRSSFVTAIFVSPPPIACRDPLRPHVLL